MRKIQIRIPATTANLGPGYDCLGLALSLYNRAEIGWEESAETLTPDQLKHWADQVPSNQWAVATAYSHYASARSAALPLIEISFEGEIPVARGLGSSATCAIAGLAAAQRIDKGVIDKEALLPLAAELEGHPDNAAPALIGGLVLSKKTRQKVGWTKLSCHPDIRVLLFIPDFRLSTSQARQVLPDSIPHRDAVANTASFGFLLEGIRTGRKELLAQGNEDYLHQEYRRPLVEDYDAVERAALAVGCSVLALSGAGPSLVGLLIGSQSEAEEKRIQIQNMLSANWQAKSLAIDEEGMVFMGEDRN